MENVRDALSILAGIAVLAMALVVVLCWEAATGRGGLVREIFEEVGL